MAIAPMHEDFAPVLAQSGTGAVYDVLGMPTRVVVTGEQTGGTHSVMEIIAEPGGGPPPHIHTVETESFWVLEGDFEFTVGEEKFAVKTGDFLFAPKNIPHAFCNRGSKPARMMVIMAPAGFENFFREIDRSEGTGKCDSRPPSEADIKRLLELAPKYGMEILA